MVTTELIFGNELYKDKLRKIPPGKNVFANASLNMGSSVRTVRHRDGKNLPYGWCGVLALGEFDHSVSGHLVLHDLKLMVEFPSGSWILIPSATLEHSNATIEKGDVRASLTLYSGGGLFRFLDNGFQTEAQLKERAEDWYWENMEKKEKRWEKGLGFLSTLEELGYQKTS